jgi:hypothetical protein
MPGSCACAKCRSRPEINGPEHPRGFPAPFSARDGQKRFAVCTICGLLAADTQRGPRNGRELPGLNPRLAGDADSKATRVDPAQRPIHLAQSTVSALKVPHHIIAFASAAASGLRALQRQSDRVHFDFCHWWFLPFSLDHQRCTLSAAARSTAGKAREVPYQATRVKKSMHRLSVLKVEVRQAL